MAMTMLRTSPVRAEPRETDAAARLAPWLLGAGWLAVVLILLAQAWAPQAVERYALWPLIAGIVLLGLPHGALDHLVPARIGLAWGRRPLGVALYLGAYVAIAAAYFALWLWQPLLAFAGFLVATVGHWGQGDQRFLEIFLGRRRPSRRSAWITLLTRGALPMTVPVLAWPETAESLFANAAAGLGVAAPALDLATPDFRAALLGALAALLALYLIEAIHAAPDASVLTIDVAEIGLLVALFTLVPAYMAIGVYFLFWHSLRHLGRLLLLRDEDAAELRRGRIARPVGRLARGLLPITLAAIALLAAVTLWALPNITSAERFTALYLVLISALTKPHLAVVALMDLEPSAAASGTD